MSLKTISSPNIRWKTLKPGAKQRKSQSGKSTETTELQNALADNRDLLVKRGEDLDVVEQKSEQVDIGATSFLAAAQKINRQNKSWL